MSAVSVSAKPVSALEEEEEDESRQPSVQGLNSPSNTTPPVILKPGTSPTLYLYVLYMFIYYILCVYTHVPTYMYYIRTCTMYVHVHTCSSVSV